MSFKHIKEKSLRIFIGLWWQEQQHLWNQGRRNSAFRSAGEILSHTKEKTIEKVNRNLSKSGFVIKKLMIKTPSGSWIALPKRHILTV